MSRPKPPSPTPSILIQGLSALQPDPSAAPEADATVRTRSSIRLAWAGGFIGLGYLALTAQASSLMLLPDPKLENKAQTQFEEAVEDKGRRGDLLDRNGYILATTVALEELHVDPARLDAKRAQMLAGSLAPLLERSEAELLGRITHTPRRDVVLARGLTPGETAHIKAATRELGKKDKEILNGVWTAAESHRYYPGREDAASLLGVVGHNGSGMAGLERTLDRQLRGETFRYMLWRDRKGRRVTPDAVEIEGGNTVVLTLDHRIQHVAKEAIAEAVATTGAQSAHAVVVDVHTGELLAMANWPTINPNNTADLAIAGIKNRAAMDAFEPGSVFKPFIAAAALEEGVATPESMIDCEGGAWVVGGKVIHDDHPHGAVSLSEVIKYSSNIGTAKLAFKLGAEKSLSYLTAFGFGRSTGLSLPGETRGTMRDAATIRPIELATTAYGHGVTATAVQLAYGMAALGNDGVRMQPMLVREVRDPNGNVIRVTEPEIDRQVVSVDSARKTVGMMLTVTEEGGTGTRARVDGYLVAGKTGTAWKHIEGGGYSETDRIGSFVGLVPAEAPRLAITVVVDSPTIGSKYGGIVAAPAFATIAEVSMRMLGVAPNPALIASDKSNDPHGKPGVAPVVAAVEPEPEAPIAPPELQWMDDGRLRTPDLTGLSLRDALVTLQGAGLGVSMQGSGRVAEQEPDPGLPIPIGGRVEVTLK
jgi:cell division protein FtsI (penicillin-binding protein 3)